MTLRKGFRGLAIGLALMLAGSGSAWATYAAAITTPGAGFVCPYLGGSMAVDGNVTWTFLYDTACANVKVTLYDRNGNFNSVWATSNVGWASNYWTANITSAGLVLTGNPDANLTAGGYDSSNNYLGGSTYVIVTGSIR
jgi:hypothetical protein